MKMQSYKHLWTEEWLDQQRQIGDPLADAVVSRIMLEQGIDGVNRMFQTLTRHSDVKFDEMPEYLVDYFNHSEQWPDYAVPALIDAGQELFRRHGPAMTMLLMFKSLPQSYACAKGVQVLHATGRLTTQRGLDPFKRRLMETAQFVIDIMSSGALQPGAKGTISALKVRLIHSTIRHFLRDKGWDTATLGDPLNQEDKAGTLMAFSALVLEGLEKLNIGLTPMEKEAYTHCWNVVGHFIGVRRELIPANAEEADELGNLIFRHQVSYSKEGEELTDALLEFLHDTMPGKHGTTPEIMVHYLLGDDVSKAVGLKIKRTLWEYIVEWLLKHLFAHRDKQHMHIGNMVKLGDTLKLAFLESMAEHFNDHKKIQFNIPPDLRNDWNMGN